MLHLRAITYVSSATQPMSIVQLEVLLTEARRLNVENSVTGVLLYSDGNFMQYFEGSEQAVLDTYARILASKQHHGVIQILNAQIAQRSFPEWEMGFSQSTKSELLALSTARWETLASEATGSLATSSGFSLLRSFWRRAQNRAKR